MTDLTGGSTNLGNLTVLHQIFGDQVDGHCGEVRLRHQIGADGRAVGEEGEHHLLASVLPNRAEGRNIHRTLQINQEGLFNKFRGDPCCC